ncbi:tellurite resistance TerB family protein [Hoeflea sp.]|uniref:tellurite resistance TerB family protein n=1 Tax=Hoeflea sp. TaxID=1940281 RepID=UPI003B010B47
MSINQLLGQFLGANGAGQKETQSRGPLAELMNPAGLGGGLAAGGLLGLIAGNKKMRKKAGKIAGTAVGIGGAAALAAITFRAYHNWQSNKGHKIEVKGDAAHTPGWLDTHTAGMPSLSQFNPETNISADGQPFQDALVRAIITAANADGHIDEHERVAIEETIARMQLDTESNMLIFDTLNDPPTVEEIAGYANGLEQASEIYLVSRLVLDPDNPADVDYLKKLVHGLSLPRDLVVHLENEIRAPASEAA